MCLLRGLSWIFCRGQDDGEQRFYDYRNYRRYSSISPPILPRRSDPPHRSKTAVDPPQHHQVCGDARTPISAARPLVDSRGNLKAPAFISNEANRTIFSATGFSEKRVEAATHFSHLSIPSLSSSVRAPSTPAPSSKPCFTPVTYTNSNDPVARVSIGPEKLQITKDSAICSPEKPYAASLLPKFQSPSISSSVAPAMSPKNPSLATISSTRQASVVGNPDRSANPQISPGPATRTPERSQAGTLLSKLSCLSVSPSIRDCSSLAQESVASSSKKPSSVTFSSTTSSSTGAPSSVWQPKLPIPLDSTAWIAEKVPSLSTCHPNKDSVSHAPLLKPSPAPITVANSTFYGDGGRIWREKKLPSKESNSETQRNLVSLSLTTIEATTFDSSLSTSQASSPIPRASSPSATPESVRSNLRVLPKYQVPKYLEEMIKKDIVPPILKCPLSPSTYADYFGTLLYAEDFYIEKWSKYLLKDVTLELRPRTSSAYSPAINLKSKNTMLVPKDFVAFKIDAVPEKRPYLLSRDFVFLQPLNFTVGPFKGILFRVVKNVILVEFGDDFHSQHSPSKKYNVSFSFNRICLKRAHQAISVATDPSFHSILFPDQSVSPLSNSLGLHVNPPEVQDPVTRIVNHKGPIPYLILGELSVGKGRPFRRHDGEIYSEEIHLTLTGSVIERAILNIYRANPCCRILLCSPTNKTSDELLRSLRDLIPAASFFRANAAFRDYMLVPEDIVPASLYEKEEECFTCPPLTELLKINVITCTFISSFRLHSAGIDSEHFSHIFLVDASLAIEPEAIVPLANLASKKTVVVVTGCLNNSPSWVRSEIARRHGLKMSYFDRLLRCEPYRRGNAMFISNIQ